ncbi:MAG: ATP-dependent sacrificial sulfur transferase LarE [Thermoproteota archaeon]|nr:ATP-dependent sacrificial sulfur transferase LarE [Thermoproteota archaeon]
METFDKLIDWFMRNGHNRAIVALSGGVDSAVVALAAKKALGTGAIAITADYKTLAEEELAAARRVASEIGITHKVIEYNELENPAFIKNDNMRCYYCRTELGQHLAEEARRAGILLVVDGSNADDLKDYRPGIRALRENGVRSPMIELGIRKTEIRKIAKSFKLSVDDKPSNACLASRIPTGSEVTYERLQRIENAEIIVKNIFGVRQVRVRDHGDLARIEVGRDELHKMFDLDKLAILDRDLKDLTFKFISIDIAGYKMGNLVVIDSSNSNQRVENNSKL